MLNSEYGSYQKCIVTLTTDGALLVIFNFHGQLNPYAPVDWFTLNLLYNCSSLL